MYFTQTETDQTSTKLKQKMIRHVLYINKNSSDKYQTLTETYIRKVLDTNRNRSDMYQTQTETDQTSTKLKPKMIRLVLDTDRHIDRQIKR